MLEDGHERLAVVPVTFMRCVGFCMCIPCRATLQKCTRDSISDDIIPRIVVSGSWPNEAWVGGGAFRKSSTNRIMAALLDAPRNPTDPCTGTVWFGGVLYAYYVDTVSK